MSNPYIKRWQRNNQYPRDGETWEDFYARIAQAMEARSVETRSRLDGDSHESAVRQDAPTTPQGNPHE